MASRRVHAGAAPRSGRPAVLVLVLRFLGAARRRGAPGRLSRSVSPARGHVGHTRAAPGAGRPTRARGLRDAVPCRRLAAPSPARRRLSASALTERPCAELPSSRRLHRAAHREVDRVYAGPCVTPALDTCVARTRRAAMAVAGQDRSPCRHYVVSPPRDLYGHRHPKDGPQRFACHACHHTFPAQRYAPHLEKCLGLGRASGARPTKRAAAVAAVTGIISIGQAHGHGASSAATHGSGAGSAGHGSAGAAYSPSLGAAHLSPYVDSFDSDSDTPQEKKRRRKKMKPARPTP
ncbi:hypothetical protein CAUPRSCDRAFT_11697 [Caulochytrium protostelioides]|uniref:SAGA-associated factor 11 n=1 Tax=Caulochytrium protostelioides TaxID=1555241 RepID=A0A4P9WVS2_9FUNG|nr:hypothetical protein CAUPRSCDRAFT_11697 [Caulochytrium protostelioides]